MRGLWCRTPVVLSLVVLLLVASVGCCSGLDFNDDFDRIPDSLHVDYGANNHGRLRRTQEDNNNDNNDDALRAFVGYRRDKTQAEPIRIKFVTDLLQERQGESTATDAQIDYILTTALPEAAARWSQHLSLAPVVGNITVRSNMCYGAFGDELGSVDMVVENADLVVIVSGKDELLEPNGSSSAVCEGRTLAVGSSCVLDQWDRPIIGFVNFCLENQRAVDNTNVFLQSAFSASTGTTFRATHLQADILDVVIHEVGHILAFSAYLFKFFRFPDGTPRTPRPFVESTVQCVDGRTITALAPSNSTVQLVERPDGLVSYSMVTPTVQQVARNQLNCQETVGARLEEQGACLGSHWHERLFFGEIMSPALSVSSQNVLSPLTLALMKDSGWYTVNFTGAEIPSFGLGAGCDFVTSDCIVDDEVPAWGKDFFCDSPIRFLDGEIQDDSLNNIVCDPSHRAWALCDLWDETTAPSELVEIPESSKRYFSDNDLVPSFILAEYCPIPTKSLGLDCTKDEAYIPFYEGESVGATSRCINAFKTRGQTVRRPACMTVRCDDHEGKVIIGNGDNEQVCSFDGEILSLGSSSEFLECPRLATVCPELFSCPGSCAGESACLYDDGPVPVCADAVVESIVGSTAVDPIESMPVDPASTDALPTPQLVDAAASSGPVQLSPLGIGVALQVSILLLTTSFV